MTMDGARVLIRGLISKPELNGVAGVVAGEQVPSTGRYPVKLSTGVTIGVKLENLLGADTLCGFDYDAICTHAVTLGLLQHSDVEEMTDRIAQGITTKSRLLEDWIPWVLAAAELQRPRLECDVGMLRPGSTMIRGLSSDEAKDGRTDCTEDELLVIGRHADFVPLKLYAEIHLPDDGTIPLCTDANGRVAAGIKRALAAQGAWGASQPSESADPIAVAAKTLQPIAIAMLMRTPEWLTSDEMLLAASCGFVIPAKPMLEFRTLGSRRLLHLLPLLKAALEPSAKPLESYAVALGWLRPRLMTLPIETQFGPLLFLEAMHAALLKGEGLATACKRLKWLVDSTITPPTLSGREHAITRDGVTGCTMTLQFSEAPAKAAGTDPTSMNLELFLPTAALDAACADERIWAGEGCPVRLPWPDVTSLAEDEAIPMLVYSPGGGLAEQLPLPRVPHMEAFPVGHVRPGQLALSGRPPPSEVLEYMEAAQAPPTPPLRVQDMLGRQLGGHSKKTALPEQLEAISLGMAKYKPVECPSVGRIADPDCDQTGGVLSLGMKEDWIWLCEIEQHVFPAGTPLHSIGGVLNQQMSNAITRALAKQTAWASAPQLIKEVQPMLISLFLDKPRWLSDQEIELAIKLRLASTRADGALTFHSLVDRSELFPLLKTALEPTLDPAANYRLGVRWVRSQHTDPERAIPTMNAVLRLEVIHDCVERGDALEAAAIRLHMINSNQWVFKVLSSKATRDGHKGISLEIHFTGRDDLRIREVFVPLEVFARQFSEDGSLERAMSEESLQARGFPSGVRG